MAKNHRLRGWQAVKASSPGLKHPPIIAEAFSAIMIVGRSCCRHQSPASPEASAALPQSHAPEGGVGDAGGIAAIRGFNRMVDRVPMRRA